ncbi:MAG: UDP-N-acetylglucosamine 1-carboxyvinyltransferase, partial [Firmicutes bacterium]|nr:UDP-N-acetylglucosamine 1-carboxyvinyltransferase [Bacillota bacterium]
KRMGADIKIEGRSAVVDGIAKLTGAQVKATDLRAGAALTLAGLVAEGETEIEDVYHILRGYDGLDQKLASLGANIQLVGTE